MFTLYSLGLKTVNTFIFQKPLEKKLVYKKGITMKKCIEWLEANKKRTLETFKAENLGSLMRGNDGLVIALIDTIETSGVSRSGRIGDL